MRFSVSVLVAATGLSGALASPTVSARQAPGTFDTFRDPECSVGRAVVETNRNGPPFGKLESGVQSIVSHLAPNCALIFSFANPGGPTHLIVDGNRAQQCITLEAPSDLLFWRSACN